MAVSVTLWIFVALHVFTFFSVTGSYEILPNCGDESEATKCEDCRHYVRYTFKKDPELVSASKWKYKEEATCLVCSRPCCVTRGLDESTAEDTDCGENFEADEMRCYYCIDCDEVSEDQLQTCSLENVISFTTTTTSTTTTEQLTTITTEQTITESTTPSTEPTTPTAEPITETTISNTESTVELTTPTTQPVTDATTPTTESVTDATTPTTESVTDATTPTTESVTDATTPTTQPITDATTPTTESVTDATTPTTQPITDATTPTTESVTDVTTPTTQQITDATTVTSEPIMAAEYSEDIPSIDSLRFRKFPSVHRLRRSLRNDIRFVCVVVKTEENGDEITSRGCAVAADTNEQTCGNIGSTLECDVCDTEACNSATGLRLSFAALLITIVTIYFQKY
ncbi:hypothetical protein EVAR_76668_1 [Eumeta japonica]|uniref:Uncharacterized protein n=1 Tax=Eumeta variegata TaxID=151549 RepID=A0A4C1YF82_EUMVA|nr:hypothetical protein EVAR_76668_1 [Eumeta japonica]